MIVSSVPVPHQYRFQPSVTARNMALRATPTTRGGQLADIPMELRRECVKTFEIQIVNQFLSTSLTNQSNYVDLATTGGVLFRVGLMERPFYASNRQRALRRSLIQLISN